MERMPLRRRWAAATALAAAGLAALAVAQPGAAEPPLPVTGTESYVPVFTFVKEADGNLFLHGLNPGIRTGTFSGTQIADFNLVIHPNGLGNFDGTVVFTGTAAGCGSGTVVFSAGGTIDLNPPELTYETRYVTLFGQGTLPVHASFTVDGVGLGGVVTDGQYVC